MLPIEPIKYLKWQVLSLDLLNDVLPIKVLEIISGLNHSFFLNVVFQKKVFFDILKRKAVNESAILACNM